MKLDLGDEVYCYYNHIHPLIKGKIIQIGSYAEGLIYKGISYTVLCEGCSIGIEIPSKSVFKEYSEWVKYYNKTMNEMNY